MQLKKTVVGSFPRICTSIDDSIKRIVDIQLKHEVDIISDGEQRHDMIEYFHQIPGLINFNGKLRIGKKIEALNNVDDFIKIKDFHFVKQHLNDLGRKNSIKTSITGPITLGMVCAMNGIVDFYKNIRDVRIFEDISNALQPIILKLIELGSLVQIDEPGLSGGFIKPEISTKIINDLIEKSINKESWINSISIHVCGNLFKVKNLFDELLNLRINTLSLAFSGEREIENIKALSKNKIEKFDKKIGVGCTNIQLASIMDVEDVGTISSRLKQITKLIGSYNIAYVHPDCGLRNNTVEMTEKILENIKRSVNLLT